ncbi:hypothetical protein FMM05_02525 [Flavobacterium zepuense]|uniref:Fibronectin type-III domain-containing protein n=1 Tax=Flavobacterium zepuense TaxID=2593302 RepID=A0A552VAN1_9FLAO|nr:hypothetical protein [Flavobacterium zepuense]TRW27534.1 hypothetical protein FMM05_02525 [Flavobacterium zepuense]
MKTINKLFLVIVAVILLCSCEDILEEDISDDTVSIISPQNNQQIESNVANFQWNEIDGADDYRVQIYSSSQVMVLDSLVSTVNFTFALNAGSYQWRVRGENFAYETAYSFPATFTMIESSDLTNQHVQLVSPASGLYTKNTSLTFSWASLSAAEHYELQLINVTDSNTIIHQETELNGTSFTLNTGVITQDAQYQWKVKAVNAETATETQYSTRNFYVDTSVPNQVQNNSPSNNSMADVGDEINFEWTAATDTGIIVSPITFNIQIATDQAFNNIIQSQNISVNNYDYTFTAPGNYYWRVRSTDEAANVGSYSSAFKIEIQ